MSDDILKREAFLRRLFAAAEIVASRFERKVDHDVWQGGTNEVDELIDLLDEGRYDDDLSIIVYPPEDWLTPEEDAET